MEQDNKKIMTVSFVAAGAIAGLVVNVLLDALAGSFGVIARFYTGELIQNGVPVGVGLLVFSLLQFNPKVRVWAHEVIIEARKVVWPARKDTTAMTSVVCVMLLISGITLGVFDVVAGNLIKLILD